MEETIMKRSVKKLVVCGIIALMVCALCSLVAFAAADKPEPAPQDGSSVSEEVQDNAADSTGSKAIAAGICVGIAACGAGIGMGLTTAKSSEGISRQPEAADKIRTNMMLGLVFIETAIIYALVVAILIIFVL